jgi:hypothetical protein
VIGLCLKTTSIILFSNPGISDTMDDFLKNITSTTYNLSPLDIIPNHLYLTNVYFFENTASADPESFMPSNVLKEAFYRSLQKFPILAGHLRRKGLNSMNIVISQKLPNMPIYKESNSSIHFDHLKKTRFHRDEWPNGINIRDPRIQHDLTGSLKLLRVHVYRLAENSGVAIVVRISHSVFDAKGCATFMNCWAELCRNAYDSNKTETTIEPSINRSEMYKYLPNNVQRNHSLIDPRTPLLFLLSLLVRLLLGLYVLCFSERIAPDVIESHLFRVSRSVISSLQDEMGRLEPNSPRISDNDIITAIFLMAFAQSTEHVAVKAHAKAGLFARTLKKVFASGNRSISAIVPCDFRHRIGVPENYTGNCAIGLYVTAPRDILLSPITTENIAKVAAISRETVNRVDRKTIEKFISRALRIIDLVGDKANVFYSMMVCQAFSNQSRLPFYDVNFGFGRPILVVPMAYPNTVAVIIPSVPPHVDIDVFLTLRPNVMAALLKKHELQSFATLVY